MAASPQFKVYNEAGEYIAAFRHADDAANFACVFESGGTVRVGHSAKLTIYRSQPWTNETRARISQGLTNWRSK
jgi:hypothetical protein